MKTKRHVLPNSLHAPRMGPLHDYWIWWYLMGSAKSWNINKSQSWIAPLIHVKCTESALCSISVTSLKPFFTKFRRLLTRNSFNISHWNANVSFFGLVPAIQSGTSFFPWIKRERPQAMLPSNLAYLFINIGTGARAISHTYLSTLNRSMTTIQIDYSFCTLQVWIVHTCNFDELWTSPFRIWWCSKMTHNACWNYRDVAWSAQPPHRPFLQRFQVLLSSLGLHMACHGKIIPWISWLCRLGPSFGNPKCFRQNSWKLGLEWSEIRRFHILKF